MQKRSLTPQELNLVFQSITEYAIFALDTSGQVTLWNEGAERVFGHAPRDIIGRSAAILFTPEDQACGAHEDELRTAEHTGRASDERYHVRQDGTRFFASGLLFPVRHPTGALTGFVKVCRDLSDRKRWEQQLIDAQETLEKRVEERTEQLSVELAERRAAEHRARSLFARLIKLQEDERRRIARDLHDDLGQQMTALHLQIETLRQDLRGQDSPSISRLDRIHSLFTQLDKDLDLFTSDLRPGALYDLGLIPALTDFAQTFTHNYQLPTTFEAVGATARLPEDIEVNLFRIAQEALNNVHKHAKASRADVLLQTSDTRVILTISDDGVGFVPDVPAVPHRSDRGTGLEGMQERAALVGGSLTLESKPDEGTSVIAVVPLRLTDSARS